MFNRHSRTAGNFLLIAALLASFVLLFLPSPASAAGDVAGAVAATLRKVDPATRTIVVETSDGARHTFHYTKELAIHGATETAKTPDETLRGLDDGIRVAVHYTARGSRRVANELDILGSGGLKAASGTVTHFDRGAEVIAIKTADGTEETFQLTDRASLDSGRAVAAGFGKASHVTVYYTEQAGTKIAHYFD